MKVFAIGAQVVVNPGELQAYGTVESVILEPDYEGNPVALYRVRFPNGAVSTESQPVLQANCGAKYWTLVESDQ